MTPDPEDSPPDPSLSDRYLWDRSGSPDPDVVRLERALGEYRAAAGPELLQGQAARAPLGGDPEGDHAERARIRRLSRLVFRFAVAASVLAALLVGVAWWAREPARPAPASGGSWSVAAVEGAPTVGGRPLVGDAHAAAGETLTTDDRSRARIEIASLGNVVVAPKSAVRFLGTGEGGHRLALDRGSLSAITWAPPRQFFVETPHAIAADLGCAFTLDVADDGASHLRVTTGYVAFERGGIESVVPAGAECHAKPGVGPGTPFFSDAPQAFRDALGRFDFEGAHAADVEKVLDTARPRDALSVWHVMVRVPPDGRLRVYDRLAALSPPPDSVTREDVLALDKVALERWRDAIR